MTYGRIKQTAENYINGNITDAKKSVKRMSKEDFLNFIHCIAGYYATSGQADYVRATTAARKLLS